MTRSTNLKVRFELKNPGELPNPPNADPIGWPLFVHLRSTPEVEVLLLSLRERATTPLRMPELDRALAACVPADDAVEPAVADSAIDRAAESVAGIDAHPGHPWTDAPGPWSASFGPYGFRIAARPGRRTCLTCLPRGRTARGGRMVATI